MENRSINENWEIFTAKKINLSIVFNNADGEIYFWASDGSEEYLWGYDMRFKMLSLTLSKETEALAVAVADLASKGKSAKAAEKRFFMQLRPLLLAWGYAFASASALMTHSEGCERGHERFRYVVKDCPLDILMSEMIAGDAALSAERDRRTLAAFTPARPTPANRNGWL